MVLNESKQALGAMGSPMFLKPNFQTRGRERNSVRGPSPLRQVTSLPLDLSLSQTATPKKRSLPVPEAPSDKRIRFTRKVGVARDRDDNERPPGDESLMERLRGIDNVTLRPDYIAPLPTNASAVPAIRANSSGNEARLGHRPQNYSKWSRRSSTWEDVVEHRQRHGSNDGSRSGT